MIILLLVSLKVIGTISLIVTLPGSLELLLVSTASFLPSRRRKKALSVASWRVAVVIPAHNEETSIAKCIASLAASAASTSDAAIDATLVVIADNCDDTTAAVAARAGATILERHNLTQRGKGYALNFAFERLIPEGFDCVLVVDADTRVSLNFITAAAGALRNGSAAIQVPYLVDNPGDTTRTRLMGIALRAFNVVRPLGRERIGLSVGILGNGFGLRSETIVATPYTASSVVEDLEYHLALVRAGQRVAFVEDATVYGEMPTQSSAAKTQRSRWEGGRMRMIVEKSPALLADVLHGRLGCLEPLLELLLLPLAFHVLLLAIAIATPLPWVRLVGIIGMAIVLLHLCAALLVRERNWRDLTALFTAPFYILWKLILIPSTLRSARAKHAWVRTERNREASTKDADVPENP